MMTAFEVAEFVGCHEETVRRAYLRGLLVSQRFGVRSRRFHSADVLDWIRRGAPTRLSQTLNQRSRHEGVQMAIRRRCNGRTCKNGRRCLEHLWFDVMHRGMRYRITANEFAVPRMEPGRQQQIESMEEARDWERLFIGEIKAGRDPRRPRTPRKSTEAAPKDVASFRTRTSSAA
jgi:excisionase family DNA binding protein